MEAGRPAGLEARLREMMPWLSEDGMPRAVERYTGLFGETPPSALSEGSRELFMRRCVDDEPDGLSTIL